MTLTGTPSLNAMVMVRTLYLKGHSELSYDEGRLMQRELDFQTTYTLLSNYQAPSHCQAIYTLIEPAHLT